MVAPAIHAALICETKASLHEVVSMIGPREEKRNRRIAEGLEAIHFTHALWVISELKSHDPA